MQAQPPPVQCHLYVIDGLVSCPRSGRRCDPRQCADCEFLQALNIDGAEPYVACAPDVSFTEAIDAIARA